jgi:cell division transport system permease protein
MIGGEAGLMPVLPVAWSDLLPLLACPLAAGAVAALAARTTALTLLKEMT